MHQLVARATDVTRLWMSCAQLASDTQFVIAMRMMGMGGTWSVPSNEATEMLSEKLPAFTEAFVAGTLSVWAGKSPEEIGRATLEPLSDTARSNRQRLAQYGPRLPGLPLTTADDA
ncbi:MAG: antifreeze protein [Aestuariivita sp.]|uniref:antifreeze protein n=1 Tax=Aestuariivita sp. TaxID=1872407 RepID=UPI003BAE41B2